VRDSQVQLDRLVQQTLPEFLVGGSGSLVQQGPGGEITLVLRFGKYGNHDS
jgi:hypothetical protein